MIKQNSILKVVILLAVDFMSIAALFCDFEFAFIATGMIALYAWLGAYLALHKAKAIRIDKLPDYERTILEKVKSELVEDFKNSCSIDISNIKFYTIPSCDGIQVTAHGAKCISVSDGALKHACASTLRDEISQELPCVFTMESEFRRAVMASLITLCASIGVMSIKYMVIIIAVIIAYEILSSWLDF